ncbi:hypothetical protein D6C84_09459 [Aureobasidium pullulans]|uniref:Uncharacterized protein n=1 Tax=Aureobasidium pullulans TaxID=5580 RepID=A0A4S9X5T6_AURPU|nr:hypothetical protein D6C84_09459 [Aureobasidium pullulans]
MMPTREDTEHWMQLSNIGLPSSLPPYESVDPSASSTDARTSDSNTLRPDQDATVHEGRKSHVFSTLQALGDHTEIKGWPEQPRKLRDRTFWSIMFSISEVLITLAPVAFIILAVLAAKLDGQPIEHNGLGRNVKRITQLGPSIFPIMFAAVAGKALKTFTRYYAERGMRLGVLELLLASQTVWGAFESQMLLRNFTVVGVHLFLLWCLSPLGGQGSLRILTTRMDGMMSDGQGIVYLPTGAMLTNMTASVFAQADAATGLAATNSLYNANLLSPDLIKQSGQDVWGNVKVPNWKTVSTVEASNDGGWRTVPPLSSPDNYTSLAGLPISGIIKRTGTYQESEFQDAYMQLDCPLLFNVSKNDGAWVDYLGIVWSASNGSSALHNKASGTQTSFFLDTNTPIDTDRQTTLFYDQNSTTLATESLQQPRNILYGSMYEVANSTDPRGVFALALRNCTVQQRYIEARARCTEDNCTVTALRPSTRFANRNPYLTRLEDPAITFNLMKNMPLATGSFRVGDSAPTELYIRGSEMPFGRASADQPEILNITNDVFESKFQLLLNTYYQLSMAPLAYTAALPAPSDAKWDLLQKFDSSGGADKELPFVPLRSNTTVTTVIEVYHCNYLWFVLLLTSSVILVMLGAIGSALSHLCHAPDMIGYVSSFTYNNPYMQVPSGGESLGAMERARLLRDLKVKIGDATSESDVGHVVFATVHRSDTVGDLNAAKLYR